MKRKNYIFYTTLIAAFVSMMFLGNESIFAEDHPVNPIIKFLKDINYSSQLKFEYDDNIFLTEEEQDADWREVFTQGLSYRLPLDEHYFQWGYTGKYAYYNEEATGILAHTANVLYSYRPFNGFSIGVRDDFRWLQDSAVTRTVGDQVLALGYIQNTPNIELKYEIIPEVTYIMNASYQFLDVINKDDDDFIDNKQFGIKGQFNYTPTWIEDTTLFAGYNFRRITFPQIWEKSATGNRVFLGTITKYPTIVKFTQEMGFEEIDMDDNEGDHNIDWSISAESLFSLYTNVKLGYQHSFKKASLRTEYTQYTSYKAMFNLSHTINPKTSAFLDYSYEMQDFNDTDTTATNLKLDRQTFINNAKITLRRKLNIWLTADAAYNYIKRDTDFEKEGYTDNKWSIAITARY